MPSTKKQKKRHERIASLGWWRHPSLSSQNSSVGFNNYETATIQKKKASTPNSKKRRSTHDMPYPRRSCLLLFYRYRERPRNPSSMEALLQGQSCEATYLSQLIQLGARYSSSQQTTRRDLSIRISPARPTPHHAFEDPRIVHSIQ